MSVVRPLPARPNLAHERKAAKALLRQLRAGEPDAIVRARAQHPDFDPRAPQLADAQMTLAREYGFTSWPRLTQYFEAFRKQMLNVSPPQVHFHSDDSLRALMRGHAHRDSVTGRTFAAYVPRFYALPMEQVFALAPTEDEARLAVARQHGTANWGEHARAAIAQKEASAGTPWEETPRRLAVRALEAADLGALQRLAAKHPEILQLPDARTGQRQILMDALWYDRKLGRETMRPIMDWLLTQGLDVQEELNRQLCGHIRFTVDEVRWLLERGANPRWIAPNGHPVLEHALLNFWNGEAVDLIAVHVTPPRALWVAAGLGDVDGVARFLDRRGRPTTAARRNRPAFDAMGFYPWSSHPEPGDEEVLLEAFFVAALNGRVQVLEYMARRGTPIDSVIFGAPIIHLAIGNRWMPVFECLVSLGADLDVRGPHQGTTPRQHAAELVAQHPDNPMYQRIANLCGIDIEATVRARNAVPPQEPTFHSRIPQALALARDDAQRAGSDVVTTENLLFGLLRHGGVASQLVAQTLGAQAQAFREQWLDRLLPAVREEAPQDVPLDTATEGILERAREIVRGKRQTMIGDWHLMEALMEEPGNPLEVLLAPYGKTSADIRQALRPMG